MRRIKEQIHFHRTLNENLIWTSGALTKVKASLNYSNQQTSLIELPLSFVIFEVLSSLI